MKDETGASFTFTERRRRRRKLTTHKATFGVVGITDMGIWTHWSCYIGLKSGDCIGGSGYAYDCIGDDGLSCYPHLLILVLWTEYAKNLFRWLSSKNGERASDICERQMLYSCLEHGQIIYTRISKEKHKFYST